MLCNCNENNQYDEDVYLGEGMNSPRGTRGIEMRRS